MEELNLNNKIDQRSKDLSDKNRLKQLKANHKKECLRQGIDPKKMQEMNR